MSEIIAKAHIKYIRISPKKLSRIAKVIRKKTVNEAKSILFNLPHKGAKLLLKALNSAEANALNNSNAQGTLYISSLLINSGSIIKRYQPRARGRMFAIKKRTSHIYYELSSKEI